MYPKVGPEEQVLDALEVPCPVWVRHADLGAFGGPDGGHVIRHQLDVAQTFVSCHPDGRFDGRQFRPLLGAHPQWKLPNARPSVWRPQRRCPLAGIESRVNEPLLRWASERCKSSPRRHTYSDSLHQSSEHRRWRVLGRGGGPS